MKDIEKTIRDSQPLFSDSLYAEIYHNIITKYKHESSRQHTIRIMVEIFKKKYTTEMKMVAEVIKKKKELAMNDMNANKKEDLRGLFMIPDILNTRINKALNVLSERTGYQEPLFLHGEDKMVKEEEEWFFKNFPEFVVAKIY